MTDAMDLLLRDTFHHHPVPMVLFDSLNRSFPNHAAQAINILDIASAAQFSTSAWAWADPLTGRQYTVNVYPVGQGGRVVILIDCTESKKIEQIHSDFISNISHEFRTPLTTLIGFIETLQGPARDDVDARERFLTIMQEQARHMAHLLDDLLILTRIESQTHQRPTTDVDLISIAQETIRKMSSQYTGINIQAQVDMLMVNGDQDEISQMFWHLLANACQYRKKVTDPVWMILDLHNERPRVQIRDQGMGIAGDDLPRVTERFYRGDHRGARIKGTGLGLAIVRQIVQHHAATLTIDSQPDIGTTVTVQF